MVTQTSYLDSQYILLLFWTIVSYHDYSNIIFRQSIYPITIIGLLYHIMVTQTPYLDNQYIILLLY